jgi:fructosamine-3-kinase
MTLPLRLALKHFGLINPAPIANGVSTQVYALSNHEVLKVYLNQNAYTKLQELKQLYESFDQATVPFELPQILSIHSYDTFSIAIETRLPGKSLQQALKDKDTHELTIAPVYFNAVTDLAKLKFQSKATSSLPSAQSQDWNSYLRKQVTHKAEQLHDDLIEFHPDLDEKLSLLLTQFANQNTRPLSILHGDIWPGNLMVDTTGTVTGILDFSAPLILGDNLYDRAIAWICFSMYSANDREARLKHLPYATDGLCSQEVKQLCAYALTFALLSCDQYVSDGQNRSENGHFIWAMDLLGQEELWAAIS